MRSCPVYSKVYRSLLLTLFLLLSPAVRADTIEVEGLLVVSDCRGVSYQQISLTEPALLDIAAGCAKRGVPLAVLVGDKETGVLYTLVSPSPLLSQYLAKPARLTGEEIAPRVVIPEKLEIRTESGWEEVATTMMM